MDWKVASDLQQEIKKLIKELNFSYIDYRRIFVFRSQGSKSRAQARIWSLPRIWQIALGQKAGYCIEVLEEKYNRLSPDDKNKVLIHELLHIPKNFSGALLSHRRRGRVINRQLVDSFFKKLAK